MRSILSSRRRFLVGTAAAAAGLALPILTRAQTPIAPDPSARPPKPPPLPSDLVKEFVGKAHANFEGTKLLLAAEPALLNATWDWGGGDFETGLGGASHVGSIDIAEFLIGKGARMDLFAATMLGRLDIVKAMLAAFPALVHSKGPHGLSLMHHARKGETLAEPVAEFLESLGAK